MPSKSVAQGKKHWADDLNLSDCSGLTQNHLRKRLSSQKGQKTLGLGLECIKKILHHGN